MEVIPSMFPQYVCLCKVLGEIIFFLFFDIFKGITVYCAVLYYVV